MTGTIQLIQITPEDLQGIVTSCIKPEFDRLKSDFQPKHPTEYMTRNEVKELLDIDLSTLWNWTKRGKLKSYGLGNRVYYKRAEVEAAIKPLTV